MPAPYKVPEKAFKISEPPEKPAFWRVFSFWRSVDFRQKLVGSNRFKGRVWDTGHFDKREYPYVAHHSSALRRSLPLGKIYRPRLQLFDGDGLYLLVQPNGRKGWRARYVKPDGREGLTSFGNYPVIGLADARRKRLEVKRMLADGVDPIETKHQAKAQALIKGRTFESVALDWHTEMPAKWAPGHS